MQGRGAGVGAEGRPLPRRLPLPSPAGEPISAGSPFAPSASTPPPTRTAPRWDPGPRSSSPDKSSQARATPWLKGATRRLKGSFRRTSPHPFSLLFFLCGTPGCTALVGCSLEELPRATDPVTLQGPAVMPSPPGSLPRAPPVGLALYLHYCSDVLRVIFSPCQPPWSDWPLLELGAAVRPSEPSAVCVEETRVGSPGVFPSQGPDGGGIE